MDAQDALGELYQLGTHGYARDVEQAVVWATKAAEQGHAPAQSRLGRLYLAGEGVPRDAERGLAWVRRAAEQGYAPAQYTMGAACQYGDAEGGLVLRATPRRSVTHNLRPLLQTEDVEVEGDGPTCTPRGRQPARASGHGAASG